MARTTKTDSWIEAKGEKLYEAVSAQLGEAPKGLGADILETIAYAIWVRERNTESEDLAASLETKLDEHDTTLKSIQRLINMTLTPKLDCSANSLETESPGKG